MHNKNWLVGTALLCSLLTSVGHAAVSAEQANRLQGDLTPFGAEREGNASGTIPDWTGGYDDQPAGYEGTGQHHINPFPDDERLFTIDSQNVDLYRDKLSAGTEALIETYPTTFNVQVYETRRTHTAPEHVQKNTQENARRAKLVANGNGIEDAYGGVPFPILSGSNEQMAKQAMWNHLTRWRGIYGVRRSNEVAVQTNGNYSLVSSQQEIFFNFFNPEADADSLENVLFYYLSFTVSPPRLAGGAVLIHETLNQQKEARRAWGYNAGQRRVRRAPNLAYDSPIAAADNLRTADDTDIFNGALDRYNWSYKGVEEIYIPYNTYRLSEKGLPYSEILGVSHINPDLVRWELHRVHVVEANLKDNARHIYQKRRFYIDEDSWSIALVDQYDARGDLWRVSMAMLKNIYELPGVFTTLDVFYDLQARRYHVQGLDTEEPSTRQFTDNVPGSRYFSPFALRRRGVR
ncbi:DUF1329 domain-containing protein [Hydrocarboniclastica marina]|uniref:DUF1329 domain-containing protein n=1 Tax=Hydrocarboniclastica marina TaxID=2259620 RepID=A0A4P7XEQ0_9ALTE|nr:DUF1329 domain-containing protein [Hydrocarboniclastica marina]MAL97001.1 outer membrane lipoprotein-sorting protein [Alteromonadaceae bacterium]QCF25419.1 DUF1329 domain-containing protein [Hydrocarboniclastica marina]